MSFKRGTLVTFVGPDDDRTPCYAYGGMFLSKKYGVSIGDKGKVVRINAGWRMVTWTRGDGSSAVSVPMRPCWLKEGHHEVIKPPPEIKQQAEEEPEVCWLDRAKATRNGTTYNLNNTCVHTESDPFEEAIKKRKEFVSYGSADYKGLRTGYVFIRDGELGTGYYLNTREVLLAKLRAAEDANAELQEKLKRLKDDVEVAAARQKPKKKQRRELGARRRVAELGEGLPLGWSMLMSRSTPREPYYRNDATRETTWDRPTDAAKKESLTNEQDVKFCTWTDTVAAWGHVMGRRAGRRGLWVQE